MIIALSGTHSTGKTTVLNLLKKEPSFKGFFFKTEITRTLKEKGFKINEEGDFSTQKAIMKVHSDNLVKSFSEDIITDRSALDAICYSKYLLNHNKLSKEQYEALYHEFKEMIYLYDFIFYFKPEFEIEDDGVRSTNKDFQKEVANIFDEIIKKEDIEVYLLKGDSSKKAKQIVKILKEKHYVN